MEFFLNFLLIILIFYVFCRLIFLLYKKGTLNKEDIFFITSNPIEYKIYKKQNKK